MLLGFSSFKSFSYQRKTSIQRGVLRMQPSENLSSLCIVRWQLDIPTYYINFTKYLELSPFLRRTIHFPPYLKRKENKLSKYHVTYLVETKKQILWTRNTDSKFEFIFKDTCWSHPPTWVWSPSWRGGSRSVSWGPPAAPGGCRSTRTVHSSRIWTRIKYKS
jgi:hypothetical protein